MPSTGRTQLNLIAMAAVVATLLVAACGGASPGPTTAPVLPTAVAGQPTGGAVTDPDELCGLLGPGDFEAVGISGAGEPSVTSDGPGSAYCVYAGESGATGGIELDVFVDDDPAAAEDTFGVILTETTADPVRLDIPGSDEAVGWDGAAGSADDYAAAVVRAGKLVVTIAAPGGTGMAKKLGGLVGVVLGRASALTT